MRILPTVPSLIRWSRSLRNFFAKLREALVPIEDQWTWTTQSGSYFEGVELETIEADEVVFRHELGEVRLPIDHLTEDSRQNLARVCQSSHLSRNDAADVKALEAAKKAGKHGKVSKEILRQPTSLRCGFGPVVGSSIGAV